MSSLRGYNKQCFNNEIHKNLNLKLLGLFTIIVLLVGATSYSSELAFAQTTTLLIRQQIQQVLYLV